MRRGAGQSWSSRPGAGDRDRSELQLLACRRGVVAASVQLKLLAASVVIAALAAASPSSAAIAKAEQPTRVLVVVMDSAETKVAPDYSGRLVEALVEHFDATVERVPADGYTRGKIAQVDRLIVVGADPSIGLPQAFLAEANAFDIPTLWAGYGLDQLPTDVEERFGLAVGYAESEEPPIALEYRGRSYPAAQRIHHIVDVTSSAVKVLARFSAEHSSYPYVAHSGNLWYVNAVPIMAGDYPDEQRDSPILVLADVLHDFIGEDHPEELRAVIRLEDVSAHVDPDRLRPVVEYLASVGAAFVIGVIPAQRLSDGSLLRLEDDAELVAILRWAQDHGGSIALHGYHHTFGTGEDSEFWDENLDAPLAGEKSSDYEFKVEDGIRILRDLGLEPLLWETPHYAASPVGYRVFANYFSHAIENRAPVNWLPYVSGPDDAGSILIPENVGYIESGDAPPSGQSVEDQLQRARLLKIVRDPWAVGFYHPVEVPLEELQALVEGLRDLGYVFTDVSDLGLYVSSDHRPGWTTGLRNALGPERELLGLRLRDWAQERFPWWSTAARVPWGILLVGAFLVLFTVRLGEQWKAGDSAAQTLTGDEGRPWVDRYGRSAGMAALFLMVVIASVIVSAGTDQTGPMAGKGGTPSVDSRREGNASLPGVVASPPVGPLSRPTETSDWELSVYYTVVEDYYAGRPAIVSGCAALECSGGNEPLGAFPDDFVAAVMEEGTGRITTPSADGRNYLNWSSSTGFWLDFYPRDARGFVLRPFRSAAAPPDMGFGTRIRITDCGADLLTGGTIDAEACEDLISAHWVVRDRFEVVPTGRRLDLYIGEESAPAFAARSPFVIHTDSASVRTMDGDG